MSFYIDTICIVFGMIMVMLWGPVLLISDYEEAGATVLLSGFLLTLSPFIYDFILIKLHKHKTNKIIKSMLDDYHNLLVEQEMKSNDMPSMQK
jgi:hypothetical protein